MCRCIVSKFILVISLKHVRSSAQCQAAVTVWTLDGAPLQSEERKAGVFSAEPSEIHKSKILQLGQGKRGPLWIMDYFGQPKYVLSCSLQFVVYYTIKNYWPAFIKLEEEMAVIKKSVVLNFSL